MRVVGEFILDLFNPIGREDILSWNQMELPDMAWENHQLKIYFYPYRLILNSSKSPISLTAKHNKLTT